MPLTFLVRAKEREGLGHCTVVAMFPWENRMTPMTLFFSCLLCLVRDKEGHDFTDPLALERERGSALPLNFRQSRTAPTGFCIDFNCFVREVK